MMQKRRQSGHLLQACIALSALAIPALGDEIVVRNDSFEDGDPAVIVGNFIPGEHAGARLAAPCDGAIVAVRIAWLEGTPGHDPTVERAIHIFDGSTFPVPGAELALLEAPLLTPGYFNEFRYLDEGQTVPLNVPVTAGQQFYVTLEFDNPTDVGNGGPSVVRDVDGCQPGCNVLYAIPGGWMDFCVYLQGDLLIRAVIDCDQMSGACCFDSGGCLVLSEADCATAAGTWAGPGTDCADDDGNGVADACQEPATCPGDTDYDGDVDLNDLAQLLSTYGVSSGATWGDGDFDADGDVDLADLSALLANYGQDCP